jgi:hypothetical protein
MPCRSEEKSVTGDLDELEKIELTTPGANELANLLTLIAHSKWNAA